MSSSTKDLTALTTVNSPTDSVAQEPNYVGQNFKYHVFDDTTEIISGNKSTEHRTVHQNLLNQVNKFSTRIVDNFQQKLSVTTTTRLSKIWSFYKSYFAVTGPFIFLILVIVSLVYWRREQMVTWKYSNQCLTKECLMTSGSLVSRMNTSISPCHNFFQYACAFHSEPFQQSQNSDSPSAQAGRLLISTFGTDTIRTHFKVGRSSRLLRFDRPMTSHLTEVNVHALIAALKNIHQNHGYQFSSAKFKVAEFFDSCSSTLLRNWYGAQPLLRKVAPILNGLWLLDRNASNETGAGGINQTNAWPKYLFWDPQLSEPLKLAQNWSWMESIKHLQCQFHVPIFADFQLLTSATRLPKILLIPERVSRGDLTDYKIRTYASELLQILGKGAGIPYGDKEYQNRMKIFTDDLKLISRKLNELYRNAKMTKWPVKFSLDKLGSPDEYNFWIGVLNAYFNETDIHFDGSYQVYSRYLDYVMKLPGFFKELKNNFTGPVFNRIMNNYMFYNVLDTFAWHLSYDFYMLHRSYNYNFDHIMELECFFVVHELFDTVLGAIYIKNYLHEKVEQEIERFSLMLKNGLKAHLKEIPWMDDKTKSDVGSRVDRMKILHKTPAIMQDEKKLNYAYRSLKTSHNYLENLFSAIGYTRGIYNRLLMGVNETSEENWSSHDVMVYDTHVALQLQLDELFIPPGMLQPPIYHHDLPAAVNFGGLGSLVGTAMGILVGEYGAYMLKDGTTKFLWTPETIQRFNEKRGCVQNQIYDATRMYFNFSDILMKSFSLDFAKVVTAIINEASGLNIARSAFESALASPRNPEHFKSLPGLDLTQKQLFYLSYAQSFCHNMEYWEEFFKLASIEPSAPFEVIVNNIVNELPDFGQTFNCPRGTPMNPEKQCNAIL